MQGTEEETMKSHQKGGLNWELLFKACLLIIMARN